MDYDVELDGSAGRNQEEEALTVRFADGREDRMRLHEYDRVYAIPGLYEEVVHNRLECYSPEVLADALVDAARADGTEPADLRVFDLAAGNGVTGEQLAERGVSELVGSDNALVAKEAAERDRPGLYSEYVIGDIDDTARLRELVGERSLNALVCAGALGLGHITAESFDRLWTEFPAGAWFSTCLHEDLAEPGASDFGDYLQQLEAGDGGEIVSRERFRHRLLMNGDAVHYVAIAVRKRA